MLKGIKVTNFRTLGTFDFNYNYKILNYDDTMDYMNYDFILFIIFDS